MKRLVALVSLTLVIGLAAMLPAGVSAGPGFTEGTLDLSVTAPTSIAVGPAGRLYVATETQILAVTLDPATHDVLDVETVASGLSLILGLAFDPTAPASPVMLYASRQNSAATDSYEGVVSTFTAPSWTKQDVITGLPSSTPYTNHVTNGLAFDDAGVLYIAQGSNTDAGLAGPNYPETPLSAAILTADVNAPSFDGAITYSPSGVPTDDNVNQTGGDVSVFAAGTRNPYDLVVHSNGYIYATDNGPNGPNTSLTCTTTGGTVAQNDELNLIESGKYYGFPNRNRGRTDTRQCTYHAPAEGTTGTYTAPISTLPAHCSCDGITEFSGPSYANMAPGDLLYVSLINGTITRERLAGDGRSVTSTMTINSGYNLPLDVAADSGGTVYIAEFGGNQISYIAPLSVGGTTALSGISASNRGPHATLIAVIAAAVLAATAVVGVAYRRGRA